MDYKKIYEAYADSGEAYRKAAADYDAYSQKSYDTFDKLTDYYNPESDIELDIHNVHFLLKYRSDNYSGRGIRVYVYPSTLENEKSSFDQYFETSPSQLPLFIYYTCLGKPLNGSGGVRDRCREGKLSLDFSNKEQLGEELALLQEIYENIDKLNAPVERYNANVKKYDGIKSAYDKRKLPSGKLGNMANSANELRQTARQDWKNEQSRDFKAGDTVIVTTSKGKKVMTFKSADEESGLAKVVTLNGATRTFPLTAIEPDYRNMPQELNRRFFTNRWGDPIQNVDIKSDEISY